MVNARDPNSPESFDLVDEPQATRRGAPTVEDASVSEQEPGYSANETAVESDDDESIADEGEASSQNTNDTVGVSELRSIGQVFFSESTCRVRLSNKVQGEFLLCGYGKTECKRPKHTLLQKSPSKVGKIGLYIATPNAGGTTFDAVESSYITDADLDKLHQENRNRLIEIGNSAQKIQDEAALRTRQPTMVRFDTNVSSVETPRAKDTLSRSTEGLRSAPTEPITPTDAPRRAQLQNWIQGVVPPAVTSPPSPKQSNARKRSMHDLRKPAPPVHKPDEKPTTPDPVLTEILATLVNEFRDLKTGLEDHNIALAKTLSEIEASKNPKKAQPVRTTIEVQDNDEDDVSEVSEDDEEGTIVVAGPASRKKKKIRWLYAVSKGRKTGIYRKFRDVQRVIKGVEGATYRRFRNLELAQQWLSQRLEIIEGDPMNSDTEAEEEATMADDTVVVPTIKTPTSVAHSVPKPIPIEQVINLTTIGPDPSTGKPNEIFGQDIQVESEVLKLLCPKGVTAEVRKSLSETAPDIVSLPGKFNDNSVSDGAKIMDQLAEAVGDMKDTNAARFGQVPRDTQWKLSTRNALDKIITVTDLHTATEELSGQCNNVITNMNGAIKEILFNAGWTSTDSTMYCLSGLLPRIISLTLQYFHELHIHLQQMALNYHGHWEDVGRENLKHHAKALMRLRQFSLTRTQMILQNYTYLRDQRSQGYMDLKLIGSLTLKWHEQALKILPPGGGLTTPQWSCAHCQTSLHSGGAKKCPAGCLKAKAARKVAKEAVLLHATDPDAFTRLIAEEKARVDAQEEAS